MAVFARIGRLFRGFIGLFISGIEARNPEALMEAAKQEFRDRMAQYNMALARMAGIAERLKIPDKVEDLPRAGPRDDASSPTTAPATSSSPAASRASCRNSRPT